MSVSCDGVVCNKEKDMLLWKLKTERIVYSVGNSLEYRLTKNLLEAVERYKTMDAPKLLNMHVDDITYLLEWEE